MKTKILISCTLLILLSCKKKESTDCPTFWGYKLPYTLYFVVKESNQRLPDSVLNNMKLYYQKNNVKTYISDFGRAGSYAYDLGVAFTRDIGFKSADDNIKNYYLEYSNNDIDTLFVDYRHYSQCEADTSSCYCLYPRMAVKYNGQVAGYDPSITQQTVYLFNKQ